MIELKLNIDITDRFENAIKTLADAIAIREKLQHEYMQGQERMSFDGAPEDSRQNAPESKETAKPTEVTPEPEKAPEPIEVTPEPEKAPEPIEVTPEPEKAQEAVKNEDLMQGMNLMQAVKAITDELRARGVEMADANARVRRRANELGLSYSSFTCLVKAIGYTEARRVALGE